MNDLIDDDAEEWLPLAEVARIKGVTRQTVSERVARLEGQGLLTTRSGPGGTKLVNIGEYEFRVRETADLAKEQAAATAQANFDDPGYRNAQTQKIKIETAVKAYELRKLRGELVDITRVNDVVAQVGEEIRRPLDQFPLRADEIHAAGASGGAVAVRSKLKEIVFEVRGAITEALRKLADSGGTSGDSSA